MRSPLLVQRAKDEIPTPEGTNNLMFEKHFNQHTPTGQVLADILGALAEFRPRATDVGDEYRTGQDIRHKEPEDLISELIALRWSRGIRMILNVDQNNVGTVVAGNQILDMRHEAILEELERRGITTETWPPPITAPVAKARSNGHKVGVAI